MVNSAARYNAQVRLADVRDARAAAPAVRPRLACGLLIAFVCYTLVGTSPFVEVDVTARESGNLLDRLVLFALFGVALAILLPIKRETLVFARRNGLLLAVVVWCLLSALWSDFPTLTLRRAAVLAMVTGIALAIAVGLDRLSRFMQIALWLLGGLAAFNILTPWINPTFAITDIGVRGMFSHKNSAGTVAMLATLTAYAMALADRRVRSLPVLGACMLIGLTFLWMTDSRTSMILVLVGMVVVGPLILVWERGPVSRLLCSIVLMLAIYLLVMVFLVLALDMGYVFQILFGDRTFTGRTDIWSFSLLEIARRPLVGSGYGAFWDVGAVADPALRFPNHSWLADVEIGVINQAHSGYLDLALQIGIPAAIVATVVVGRALVQGFVVLALPLSFREDRALAYFAIIVLLVLVVHNLMETSLFARGQILGNFSILAIFLLERLRRDAMLRGVHRLRFERSGHQPALPLDTLDAPPRIPR